MSARSKIPFRMIITIARFHILYIRNLMSSKVIRLTLMMLIIARINKKDFGNDAELVADTRFVAFSPYVGVSQASKKPSST